jgi:hypothetical protein
MRAGMSMGVFLGVGWHTLSKGERLELAVICCQLDLKRLNNEYLFPCSRIIPNIADSAHDILIGAKRRQGPGGSDRKRRGSAKGRRVRRGKLATAVGERVARFHVPHSSPPMPVPTSESTIFFLCDIQSNFRKPTTSTEFLTHNWLIRTSHIWL